MATKMKGLFKGLRYISQIFEEDKEQDIQIGFPTDVKHVAHIGWDGPSAAAADSNPSWMKEFKATEGQSAPLDSNGKNKDDPEINWVSEDSKKGNRATPDSPEVPRSSRRHSSDNNDSPRKKESSTKQRHSRRNNSKEANEIKSALPSDLPSQDLSKKSRRKKSKDTEGGGSTRTRSKDNDGGGSTRSRSKDKDGGGSTRSKNKPPTNDGVLTFSDPGPDTGSVLRPIGSPIE
ncbi:hypothetical protein CASFOL_008684 [Castilleja foliolosa]|uniref:CRIB domain-containing protein n=1 Tax=Castilleja foliolosa TaxID=1961234 RepID=A0ABD3E0U5_9LAMI